MFYVNISETSVKVSDIAMARELLFNHSLIEAIDMIKTFHEDMKTYPHEDYCPY